MLQANVRADASSRFASDYRWGYSLLYRQVGLFLVNLGSLKISRLII